MTVVDARTFLEHLGSRECWELLGERQAGRIGVLVEGAPEIYPINYAAMGETVVFRTDPGTKMRGLHANAPVSFEIDEMDAGLRTGWSVLVKGRVTEITDPVEVHHARQLPLELWTIGEKGRWFKIEPHEVTGRRIGRRASPSARGERTGAGSGR